MEKTEKFADKYRGWLWGAAIVVLAIVGFLAWTGEDKEPATGTGELSATP